MGETNRDFNMDTVYSPGEIEKKIYQTWEESGAFGVRARGRA